MKDRFSLFEVRDLLGIRRNRLQEWLSLGYIKASVKRSDGRGFRNYFSKEDLYRILLFDKLRFLGVHRTAALALIKDIEVEELVKLRRKYYSFWPSPEGGWIGVAQEKPISLADDEIFRLVINLEAVKMEVDEKLE